MSRAGQEAPGERECGRRRMHEQLQLRFRRVAAKVYVEDGVPLKIRTDEQDEDSIRFLSVECRVDALKSATYFPGALSIL